MLPVVTNVEDSDEQTEEAEAKAGSSTAQLIAKSNMARRRKENEKNQQVTTCVCRNRAKGHRTETHVRHIAQVYFTYHISYFVCIYYLLLVIALLCLNNILIVYLNAAIL